MKALLPIVVNLFLFGFVSAEMRMWTDVDGNRFAGEFSKEALGRIYIRDESGDVRSILLDSLPEPELEYVLMQVPPALEIMVRRKDRELPKFAWSSPNYYTTLHTFSITLEKESKLDYKGELSVELFVLGHDLVCESSDSFVLMHHSRSLFRLPPGRRSCCEITVRDVRFEKFSAGYISISSVAERGTEYVGYIVAVSDSRGQVIACKESGIRADWITDDLSQSVETLRRLYSDGYGSRDSCHFKEGFKKMPPPRIPWFPRAEQY